MDDDKQRSQPNNDQTDDDHDFSDFDDLFEPEELDESAAITKDNAPAAPAPSTSPKPHPASELDDGDALTDLLDEIDSSDEATISTPDEPSSSGPADQKTGDEIADAVKPMESATGEKTDETDSDLLSDDDFIDAPLADILENEPLEKEEDPDPFEAGTVHTAVPDPNPTEDTDDTLTDSENNTDESSTGEDSTEEGNQGEEFDALGDEFEDFLVDLEEEEDAPTSSEEFGSQVALDPVPETAPDSETALNPSADAQPIIDNDILEDVSDEKSINPAQELDDPDDLFDHETDHETTTDDLPEEEEDMKQNMIALIAGAVALLASMGAVWLGYSAKADLASRPVEAASSSILDAAQIKEMQQKIGNMDARLKKLATQLATQGGMSPPVSDAQVEAIATRTNRLEQLVSDIKEQIGHLANRPASVTPIKTKAIRPSVHPVSTTNPASRTKATPRPANHGWFVNLTSHSRQKNANKQVRQLKKLGMQSEIKKVLVKGHIYYRVRIPGFSNKMKAKTFKSMLAAKHHITDSWVSNQ